MPVPVPQFIKEETKIMGILTFTQLTIVVIGFGFLILLYFTINLKLWFFIAGLGTPIILLVAFGQIEGVSVFRLLPYIFRHFWLPKNYLWSKEEIIITTKPQEVKEEPIKPAKIKKELDLNTLEQIAKYLDE